MVSTLTLKAYNEHQGQMLGQPRNSWLPRPSILLWSLKKIHRKIGGDKKVFTEFEIWCDLELDLDPINIKI